MPARHTVTVAMTGWSRVRFGLHVLAVATVASSAILLATLATGAASAHPAPVLTWAGVTGT